MTEEINFNDGYRYIRVVYEWSLDQPLIRWFVHHKTFDTPDFQQITDMNRILDLEQQYYMEKKNDTN